MTSEIVYAISNSSLNLYPYNSRTNFCNKLPKELSAINRSDNSLWISVENFIMENSIITYQKKSNVPDIIFTNIATEQNKFLYMSERCFDTEESVELFLMSEFRALSLYFSSS